jgi:tRNA modification GTPase
VTGGSDTIVALSTATGVSPRAVVRMSGPRALACTAERFESIPAAVPWRDAFTATRGRFRLLGEGVAFPVVLYVMRAPRSYTREDVAEIHAPGSPALLDMVLDDLLAHSGDLVRLAQPGEFTRRAFLSGRIDLAQAEAVLSLVHARTESELAAAARSLGGEVTRTCALLAESITELRADVEAHLDFAEHDTNLVTPPELTARLRSLRRLADRQMAAGCSGRASSAAVEAVLFGPPNAGKSSLLNRLVGSERAVVHHTPGTTRDSVRDVVRVRGVRIGLADTAGVGRDVRGPDARSQDQALALMSSCALLVLVVDGSVPLHPGLLELVASVPPSRLICAISKCDLPPVLDPASLACAGRPYETMRTSSVTGEGIAALRDALWRAVVEGRADASPAECLLNARQREAVRACAHQIAAAQDTVESGGGYELVAFHLQEAARSVGRVTGAVTSQDVLDRVFARFCIGK